MENHEADDEAAVFTKAEAKAAKNDAAAGSVSVNWPLKSAVAQTPREHSLVDKRTHVLCTQAIGLGIACAFTAQILIRLIFFVTNFSFFGRFSIAPASPADNHLGWPVVFVPVAGSLIVGFMARYGSKAIRGHGIPEAMEQILTNQSRIPARVTWLKPLSAAVSIGTGGPFGAEGPIIATGGALGSLVGQVTHTTPLERKTLLAAGAAGGMAATFGSPVSAVLLAIELLLFEYRPRSIIPVALAAAAAAGIRMIIEGTEPVFSMPNLVQESLVAQAFYIALGALSGVAAVAITRLTYFIEDLFELIPIHWMWWPAIGGVVVGLVGWAAPRTLGVGYANISDVLMNNLGLAAVSILCIAKLVSWSVSLGSGTSGGTLAPLFTIGGCFGAMVGQLAAQWFPEAGIDPRIAALVGMAAVFAGASRALLASVVFAFETTLQPLGLLPLLGGCTASFLVSCLLMKHSIMTEKIARRGVKAPDEYLPDLLSQIVVRDVGLREVVTLKDTQPIREAIAWLESDDPAALHQGFPVVGEGGVLVGVLTRRDFREADPDDSRPLGWLLHRPPMYVYDDCTLRQAADHMVNHDVGRLPIVSRAKPHNLIGIVTRSDILMSYRRWLSEGQLERPAVRLFGSPNRPRKSA
jgi:H+/Cl- antiporter ClcA/CBS domain-containing protein